MLPKLKIMLGIPAEDVTQDELLQILLDGARNRLAGIIGGLNPPASMEHIVIELAIIRFNRIGSEGLKTHTVEGETYTFSEDDFEMYREEIDSFLDKQSGSKGKVRFL